MSEPLLGATRGSWAGLALAFVMFASACQTGPAEPPPSTSAPDTPMPIVSASPVPEPTMESEPTSPPEPADLVFTGGEVVTMDPDLGTVEAIAISGERIIAVGSSVEIAGYTGPETLVVDLKGRTVNPGFVDAHTHILTDMGGIEAGQRLALANGITSLGDASIEPGWPERFAEAAAAGDLRIRSSLYLTRTDYCGEDLGRWYEAFAPDQMLADRVRIAGVKIFSDGGACGRLAMSEPFLEGVEIDAPFHDLDTLTGLIRDAHDLGYQVLIHAQGDLAIAEVQDAYAAVLGGDKNALRHRIDHNVFPTAETIGRYSELGLVAVLFGSSEACSADLAWTDFYRDHGDRPGDIVAANPDLVVAWHGDDPLITPINPIYELFSLVTRAQVTEAGEICDPPAWMADAGIPVEQALAMMTTGSAYALRQEQVVGSLTPGKLADLVVLSGNLLTVPTSAIPDIELLMTMIGGVTEYCAPGAEAWCPGFEPPTAPEVSASASRADHSPELLFDGVAAGESFWSSGADPPGWIQVTFAEPTTVSEIRFVVYQNPPSQTVHELEVLAGGEWTLVETFRGETATLDVLTWQPAGPMENIESFRMTTLESLSWPEWFEIEIDSIGE